MEELIENVKNWAADKGLLSKDKSLAQMAKVTEEVGEVASALLRNDKDKLMDGIGDVVVTLILLAEQNNMTLHDCLQQAYNEIKNRTGKVNELGTFIKD